jgi:ABC-type sugar transport system ATPase subunit
VLAGENGAGKSTLIKVLGGVHQPDAGHIAIDGVPRRFHTPRHSAAAGVAIIHQELSLVPNLSVADNLFLGRESTRLGWLSRSKQHAAAERALEPLNLTLDVRRNAGEYSIAVRQSIEIAKALLLDARIIVMDEPTSALREPEVRCLFACISDLTRRGCGIVYITHKIEEVYQIATRITVLRDGCWIVTGPAEHIPAPALIHHMVGRDEASARNARPTAGLDAQVVRGFEWTASRSLRGVEPIELCLRTFP